MKRFALILAALLWCSTAGATITVSGSDSGCTVTTSGGNTIYSYTGTGSHSFVVTGGTLQCQALVVGGGGGGGGSGGSGAGAGAVATWSPVLSGTTALFVGPGGTGMAAGVYSGVAASGSYSYCGNVYAGGGGGGASENAGGVSVQVGSGGGAGQANAIGLSYFLGNNGGHGHALSSPWPSGGGGGAGTVGGDAVGSVCGNGGAGVVWSVTGGTYGGGGGGGAYSGNTPGVGGTGGGGNASAAGNGSSGTANTGGGGGAGGGGSSSGGNGGSGVVIIAFPTAALTYGYDPGTNNVLSPTVYLSVSGGTQQGTAIQATGNAVAGDVRNTVTFSNSSAQGLSGTWLPYAGITATGSDTWIGTVGRNSTGASYSGTLTTTASAMLTSLTVHGTTGTFSPVNAQYVLVGQYNWTSGTLNGTLGTCFLPSNPAQVFHTQSYGPNATTQGTYYAPLASSYYGNYGVNGAVAGTITGSYSNGSTLTLASSNVFNGIVATSGTETISGTLGDTWTLTSGTGLLSGLVAGGSGGVTYSGSASQGYPTYIGGTLYSGSLSLAGSSSMITSGSGTLYSGPSLIGSNVTTLGGTASFTIGNNAPQTPSYVVPDTSHTLHTGTPYYGPGAIIDGNWYDAEEKRYQTGYRWGINGTSKQGKYAP